MSRSNYHRRKLAVFFRVALAPLVAALVQGVAPCSVAAQTLELPRSRQGYYMGAGYNLGLTQLTEEDDNLGWWLTSSLSLRAGQMVTEHLGLGLGIHLGGAAEEPEVASLSGLDLEGQWELLENLALRGGVGFGIIALQNEDDPDEPLRGSFGGAYSVGLGYDWFPRRPSISGGWSISPVAMFRYLPGDPVAANVFTLGIELLYWTGLPNNELELPPGVGYEDD